MKNEKSNYNRDGSAMQRLFLGYMRFFVAQGLQMAYNSGENNPKYVRRI